VIWIGCTFGRSVADADLLGQTRLAYGAGRRLWWFGAKAYSQGMEVVWTRNSEGDVCVYVGAESVHLSVLLLCSHGTVLAYDGFRLHDLFRIYAVT
jgi:hypothetical protein